MLLQEAGLERVDYSSGWRQSQVPGSCDNGNENSGSMKCGYFFTAFLTWALVYGVCWLLSVSVPMAALEFDPFRPCILHKAYITITSNSKH